MQRVSLFVSFLAVFFLQASLAANPSCDGLLGKLKQKVLGLHSPSSENHIDTGLAEAQAIIKISESLRHAKKDFAPENYKTHIAGLVPEAQKFVELFEADMLSRPIWGRTKEMKLNLARLQEELSQRKQNHQVTFEWLFYFSARIATMINQKQFWAFSDPAAKLATQLFSEKRWISHDEAVEIFGAENSGTPAYELFRSTKNSNDRLGIIPMPTTANLGLFAMNRLLANGISPLGMIRGTIITDGIEYGSLDFWQHDNAHLLATAIGSPEVQSYLKSYLQKAERLPPDRRFKAELIFFYFVHEMGVTPIKAQSLKDGQLAIKEDFQLRLLALESRALNEQDFGAWLHQQNVFKAPYTDARSWLVSAINEFIQISEEVGIDVH